MFFSPEERRRVGAHRGAESDGEGGRRTTENSIRRVDAPLCAITIRDQVRIFTTCQISPPCPQRARNYILETDWKAVFAARRMRRPGACLPWPWLLSEAYPFHRLLPSLAITLQRAGWSLERRNGIHAVNATFHRFIIGPIHSLTQRLDRGASCQWPLHIISRVAPVSLCPRGTSLI